MAKEPARRSAPTLKRSAPKKKPPKKKPPKKKPPKRKKLPKRKKVRRGAPKAYNESKVADIEAPPQRTLGFVRHEAGLAYIYDAERHSIEWWHEQHYKGECSLTSMKKWANQDQWVGSRERHWEQIYAHVAREIAGEVAQAHIEEAKQIVEARHIAFGMISGVDKDGKVVPLPEVKSYEGVVGAFVKLDERLDKKRSDVLDALPLGSQETVTSGSTGVRFTDEEYQTMARALIRERYQLPASTEEEAEDVGESD